MTDIEIANSAQLKNINKIAGKLNLSPDDIFQYGKYKAKISSSTKPTPLTPLRKGGGKLVLVTAINPTPMGEGKTTVSIGLADGMAKIGKRVCLALREPSLGPCFGLKGGATGGGRSQIAPMADINLHFNGDIHALTAANNLLASMIENHIHWGNKLRIAKIFVPRALDINDRALRKENFIITVATELMAILCLATDISNLQEMCGDIIIGENDDGEFITARDINANGAMAALLKDAIQPNLVQTLENVPAIVHGGPFANIAHGCNSIIATRTALGLADYVITEAGFGADLGGEKFFDIKCRRAGIKPDAVVIVATMRAIKYHGPNFDNLRAHIENMRGFGAPVIIAINRASETSAEDIAAIKKFAADLGAACELCRAWEDGGDGAADLANAALRACDSPSEINLLYPDDLPLAEKARIIAKKIYRADDIDASDAVLQKLARFEKAGFGHLPVCIAKTPASLSADPKILGLPPAGYKFPLKDAFLYAGAGMVVITAGAIMRMPGLPIVPAAENIRIDERGEIVGLF